MPTSLARIQAAALLFSLLLSASSVAEGQSCRVLQPLEADDLLMKARFIASDDRAAPTLAMIGIPQYASDSVAYIANDSLCASLKQKIQDALPTLDVNITTLPDVAIYKVGANHFMADINMEDNGFLLLFFIVGGNTVKLIRATS